MSSLWKKRASFLAGGGGAGVVLAMRTGSGGKGEGQPQWRTQVLRVGVAFSMKPLFHFPLWVTESRSLYIH